MTTSNKKNREKLQAIRYQDGKVEPTVEFLPEELPLQLSINGKPFTITMRTPGHDRYLARGIIHTESLLVDDETFVDLRESIDTETGVTETVNAIIAEENLTRELDRRRTLAATSSCGLCGKTSLDDLEVTGCPLTIRSEGPFVSVSAIPKMFEAMRAAQADFSRTGGSHAAALFAADGTLLQLFEDIGRHNAVDKAVGWCLMEKPETEPTILTVSGRLSYEIVSKCWRGGIPVLLAVSAPSTLAVSAADRLGITLGGFCRGNRATVYTHRNRIV